MDDIFKYVEYSISKRCAELGIENPVEKYKEFLLPEDIYPDILFDTSYSFDDFGNKSKFYFKNGGNIYFHSNDYSRPLSAFWVRELFIKYCGFTVVTTKLIDALIIYLEKLLNKNRSNIRILEIGSGLGTLTYGLRSRGIPSTMAVDYFGRDYPFDNYKHIWIQDTINANQEEALTKYINDIDCIICCWPDIESGIENIPDIIKRYRADLKMIYCGENYGGCTANNDFFNLLKEMEPINVINSVYKRWQGIHDSWYIVTF